MSDATTIEPQAPSPSSVFTAYELAEYVCSKDYARLADLAKKHSILCLVDYRGGGQGQVRDVARTQFMAKGNQEVWSVCARGFGYITAFNQAEFIGLCEQLNVEFIEPRDAVA